MNSKIEYPRTKCGYRILFCTKYVRSVLMESSMEELLNIIREVSLNEDATLLEVKIFPDHVFIWAELPPTLSPYLYQKRIKAASYKALKEKFKDVRTKVPTLWTKEAYIASVGEVNEDAEKEFIQSRERSQRKG